jgi:hypothetical protein
MSMRIAVFASLVLTLGTAMAAVVSRGSDSTQENDADALATIANQEIAAVETLVTWTQSAAPPDSLTLSRPL